MNPQKIKNKTRSLGAPKEWDHNLDGPCETLDIRDGLLNGSSCMFSLWLPTPEELALLNKGVPVTVSIVGTMHPPIAVYVEEN